MRREPEQQTAFSKSLANETDLELLEIAEPAVDETRRTATGPDRYVVSFYESCSEPPSRGVEENPAAGDAAANDEQVPAFAGEAAQVARAGLDDRGGGPGRSWS